MDPKFDSNTYRNASLWALISGKLTAEGHKHSADQCELKMSKLMDKFKNFRESRKATGNNTGSFPHEEELSLLMGHWVNVEPEITFSFGCMSSVEGRQASQYIFKDSDDDD